MLRILASLAMAIPFTDAALGGVHPALCPMQVLGVGMGRGFLFRIPDRRDMGRRMAMVGVELPPGWRLAVPGMLGFQQLTGVRQGLFGRDVVR